MNTSLHEGQPNRCPYGWLSKPAIYEFTQQIIAGPKGRQFQKNFLDNPAYIAAARARVRAPWAFFFKRAFQADLDGAGVFDAVFETAVLHHLSNGQANALIELAHRALVPGGYPMIWIVFFCRIKTASRDS
jgi:hypothetical protein